MDSMRSLNRSLPPTSTSTQKPPEAVLQAFRDAALSVTKLYKEATNSQQRERQAGYQDALSDLLLYLDKASLGLDDGEGWLVRQWATSHLDGSAATNPDASESEDDKDSDKQGDGTNNNPSEQKDNIPESSPAPEHREALPVGNTDTEPMPTLNKTDAFTFRASPTYPYPRDVDMNTNTQDQSTTSTTSTTSSPAESQHVPLPQPQPQPPTQPQPTQAQPSHRPRRTRYSHTPSHRHDRHTRRAAASGRGLGPGTGSKRKIDFGDFFGLAGLPEGKDGRDFGSGGGTGGGGGAGCGGGGKKSRTS